MKILLALCTAVGLSGCSNVSYDGLGVTATTTVATVIGTVVGGPPVGAAAGVITGVITDAAIPPSEESTVEILEAIPVEERAAVLKNQNFWMAVESLGYYVILAILGFFLIPMIIGYFMPNRRQRKLERMAFDHPDISNKDL